MVEMFLGKIKWLDVGTIADQTLINYRCEIWKRKETKFEVRVIILPVWLNKIFRPVSIPFSKFAECAGHMFSNLAAELTLTIHCNSWNARANWIITSGKLQTIELGREGKLQTIEITSDLKQKNCRIFLFSTMLNYRGIRQTW